MSTKKLLVLIVAVIVAFVYHQSIKPVSLGPGVKAPDIPIQQEVVGMGDFQHKGFTITPLARFDITAKVILKENYSYDQGAEISKTDLALGWGRMSDESVLESISFSQSGRWYRYRYETAPIPQQEIQTHSANMHLIPSDDYIAKQIKKVKAGQVVNIEGYLVSLVNNEDGWNWKSSLTRNDTGGGACELIFVERLNIVEG